jgi:[ribosomal protein S5]-alanine N-acetyltransferase
MKIMDSTGDWDDLQFPEFQTPRLGLRNLRAGDEEFLARLDSDMAVMQYIHSGPLTPEAALKYARVQVDTAPYRRNWGKWMVVLCDRETSVGWVELAKLSQPRRDDLAIGYEFAPEHWGHGYATEAAGCVLEYAFTELELDRLAAIARPENAASLRVLEKLGFRRVGKRRDEGGKMCGEYRVSVGEWRTRPLKRAG